MWVRFMKYCKWGKSGKQHGYWFCWHFQQWHAKWASQLSQTRKWMSPKTSSCREKLVRTVTSWWKGQILHAFPLSRLQRDLCPWDPWKPGRMSLVRQCLLYNGRLDLQLDVSHILHDALWKDSKSTVYSPLARKSILYSKPQLYENSK